MTALGPGDLVECVDASPCRWSGAQLLQRRAIYRVASVCEALTPNGEMGPSIVVEGIDRAWDVRRFRPCGRGLLRDLLATVRDDARQGGTYRVRKREFA